MDNASLDYLFHPRAIAIAGVSTDSTKFNAGRRFMQALIDCGFKGKLYPINPGGGEIAGVKVYQSIVDVPGMVDYVVSAIPAKHTPRLIAGCATKGVKAIHLFTSGFAEIEDKEGKRLEVEVLRIARRSGIRLIGPNCMGLYCPRAGLSFAQNFPTQSGFPKQSGPLGLVAQSGGNCIYCIREATSRGVYFSKVISYGNAVDINETDLLEYLAGDTETEIVAAYVEGVKDGSRFASVLRRVTKVKPVIVFKAGDTETGARTAASHTGAMSGSNRIWRALLKQSGAIQVGSIEEMVDVSLAILRLSLSRGRNTAVIGVGGGASVICSDDCSDAGLVLPMLPIQTRRRLKALYDTEAGCIFRNPVDIVPFMGTETLMDSMLAIASCDQVDLVIIQLGFDIWALIDRGYPIEIYLETIINFKNMVNKPVVVTLHQCATNEAKLLALEVNTKLCEAGFAVYPSVRRAASAINKVIRYYEWREEIRENDG
jgi:acyl-CoA synthetase (NDP forming)